MLEWRKFLKTLSADSNDLFSHNFKLHPSANITKIFLVQNLIQEFLL